MVQRGDIRQYNATGVDNSASNTGNAISALTDTIVGLTNSFIEAKRQAEEIKVDTLISKSNNELYGRMEQLKIEYIDDPANPQFLNKSKQLFSEIKTKYKQELSRFGQKNFDNKWLLIEGKTELSNTKWSIETLKQNTILNLETSLKEQASHARQLGRDNDFDSFIAINEIELPSVRDNSAKLIGKIKANNLTVLQAKENTEAYFEENVIYHPKSALLKLEDKRIINFLGGEKVEKLKEKAYKAESHRVLNDAVSDPEEALEKIKIGEYKFKDEKQKNEALEDIKKIKTNKDLYAEIQKIQKQTDNEAEALTVVNDSKKSFEQKLLWINEQDLLGNISNDFAADARRVINSKKDMAKKTGTQTANNSEFMSNIILQIHDLNAISDTDSTAYLIGIRNVQKSIINAQSAGKITSGDAKKLNNQLRQLSSKKQGEATVAVGRQFQAGINVINKNLPPEQRGQAIRDLFYSVTDEEIPVKKEERNAFYQQKANEVIKNIKGSVREKAQKSVDDLLNNKSKSTDNKVFSVGNYKIRVKN